MALRILLKKLKTIRMTFISIEVIYSCVLGIDPRLKEPRIIQNYVAYT
jgi:hypothetical protein